LAVTPQPDGSFQLSWPTNIQCHLQTLTDPAGLGTAAWVDIANSTNPYTVYPDPGGAGALFRLTSP